MSAFVHLIQQVTKQHYYVSSAVPFYKYITTGDPAELDKLRQQSGYFYWLSHPVSNLPAPEALTVEEKRGLEAMCVLNAADNFSHWLHEHLAAAKGNEEYIEVLAEAYRARNEPQALATGIIETHAGGLEFDGAVTSLGRYLLSLSDPDLLAALENAKNKLPTLRFLQRQAPERMPALAEVFLTFQQDKKKPERYIDPACCLALLEIDAAQYEEPIAAAIAQLPKHSPGKVAVLTKLCELFPDKHYEVKLRALYLKMIAAEYPNLGPEACRWMAQTYGAAAMPDLLKCFFENVKLSKGWHHIQALAPLTEVLGEAAAPAAATIAERSQDVNLDAVEYLVRWPHLPYDDLILRTLNESFAAKDTHEVATAARIAGKWKLAPVEEQLWKLCEHKSRPVREAAARALAKGGDAAAERAGKLLSAKKAAARSAAVTLLSLSESPRAAQLLESRVDEETDEEVRDQMLLALEKVWEASGRKITRADIEQRAARAASKLTEPVAAWLGEETLPGLAWADGGAPLDPALQRYLIYRQSRSKEMRADVEARPLIGLIDRQTSGDFALAVLQRFFASAMSADERWALALATLLGDDRLVAPLMQQIRKWVDSNRGKMAEYAAEALALLGSDVALCAVDALSIRYRSKQKNIGKAAGEAFAAAAERLGVTVDELGDRVVPWLGFEPHQPRVIEHGDKRIEVRIGLDFKPEFRDVAKGKKIASLPAWVPAEVKTEFKDLGATLKEVVKGQLVRIENLMVRQFRWPLARWRELFLAHPLLFPFAARMLWGVYGEDGRGAPIMTFRALEDGSLTDVRDEAVELPQEGTVGIVHPLELSPEDRTAWRNHFADYNVESPILQLERPVLYPSADDAALKINRALRGTEINAMTFRSRAEKLGWQRGSVQDGGSVYGYRKSFPGAGVDAILSLEGMYIGIDMSSSIKLEDYCFVRAGTVTFGSYTYDEPQNDSDARLIPFGEVPPIVYSETVGDLAKISGKQAEAEEE